MPFFLGRIVTNEYIKGPQGQTGLDGIQGETGLQGIQGQTGVQGIIGSQGNTGLQGSQGVVGPQGQTGIQGHTGAQGINGTNGVTGAQGLVGLQGSQGETGLQGSQGSTGLAGPSSGLITVSSPVNISNTNVETTIVQTTILSSQQEPGSCFRFRFQGTHQGQANSGTLTFRIYIGNTAGQTIVLASQSSARSQVFCEFEGIATIRTIGTNGTYIVTGKYLYCTSATALTHAYQGGATTTTVNTTQDNNIKITAQWATASATNILLIQNAFIEQIN